MKGSVPYKNISDNILILIYAYRSLVGTVAFISHEVTVDDHATKFDILIGTFFIDLGKGRSTGRGPKGEGIQADINLVRSSKGTSAKLGRCVLFVIRHSTNHDIVDRNVGVNDLCFFVEKIQC